MHYSGRAVQQWTVWSRNLAVALQCKSRGGVYAVKNARRVVQATRAWTPFLQTDLAHSH